MGVQLLMYCKRKQKQVRTFCMCNILAYLPRLIISSSLYSLQNNGFNNGDHN